MTSLLDFASQSIMFLQAGQDHASYGGKMIIFSMQKLLWSDSAVFFQQITDFLKQENISRLFFFFFHFFFRLSFAF